MLIYVKLTNFRGMSRQFDLGDPDGAVYSRVGLEGKNGSRKTTVREAISFLFTGKDSLGTAKPTHLISMGEDTCEVSARTRRGAVITRSLTQKGGGSLRMQIEGEQRTLTQTDFEGMLCPSDVFLSVFVPSFLLTQLPKNRQSAVLSYTLPPVDRQAYMCERVGGDCMGLDYSKRPDILQKQLADERNRISHRLAEQQGQIEGLRARLGQPKAKPLPPPEVALCDLQEDLKNRWSEYDRKLSDYNKALRDIQLKTEENERIARERQTAEAALRTLCAAELPLPPPAFLLEAPAAIPKPQLQHEEERDRCPSCGQTVGLKHRELVRAQNQKLREEYEKAYADWVLKKGDWEAARAEHALARKTYEERYSAIQETNSKIRARRSELENQLNNILLFHRIPEPPIPPEKPAEEFSAERYDELKNISHEFYKQLGAYDAWRAAADDAAQLIQPIEAEIAAKAREIEWHRLHEEALKDLPAFELQQQKEHLQMPGGYELRVEEGLELFDQRGCPYGLLSSGQKMHADFQICLKVNALLKRKVGMVFLDDFDLADWRHLLAEASETVQIYTAHVNPTKDLALVLSNPLKT